MFTAQVLAHPPEQVGGHEGDAVTDKDPTDKKVSDSNSTNNGAAQLPCSFSQFLVSLGSSALVHLGEVVDPGVGRVQRDPKLARHSINVLEVLKVKTEGNLDADESALLDALIRDLEQKYAALNPR